jgi:hypothetical protein
MECYNLEIIFFFCSDYRYSPKQARIQKALRLESRERALNMRCHKATAALPGSSPQHQQWGNKIHHQMFQPGVSARQTRGRSNLVASRVSHHTQYTVKLLWKTAIIQWSSLNFFFMSWRVVRLGPLGTRATSGPIVPVPDGRWVWSSRWNENWQGKPKYSEKTWTSATLPTTNPTWPGLPATNRLSCGTAMITPLKDHICVARIAFWAISV